VVRDERPGGRTPGNGVQRRGLDLPVALPIQLIANTVDDLDPFDTPFEHLGAVNQVEIAMPQAIFHVLHAAPLVRVRQQRLAEKVDRVGENRQFTALGELELAIDAQEIAQVQLLRQCPASFADLLLPDINLNAFRPILEVEKLYLAHAAPLHDAASGTDP